MTHWLRYPGGASGVLPSPLKPMFANGTSAKSFPLLRTLNVCKPCSSSCSCHRRRSILLSGHDAATRWCHILWHVSTWWCSVLWHAATRWHTILWSATAGWWEPCRAARFPQLLIIPAQGADLLVVALSQLLQFLQQMLICLNQRSANTGTNEGTQNRMVATCCSATEPLNHFLYTCSTAVLNLLSILLW